jgi:dinuclear metal center YbgI/SA1388 family protein
MKLKDLCSYLDSSVPLSFQESYDNSGLQVGLPEWEISSVLLTLDVTEAVIDEAVNAGCGLIISHHPLIFHGIKSITGRTFTERILLRALKNNIAVYSSHTNLDIFSHGVSRKMAEKLGLEKIEVLSPLKKSLIKLVTYIPESHFDIVKEALFKAGAGVIGNYDQCGFSVSGTGCFRGKEKTNPFVGEKGKTHFEKEIRFETVLFSHLKTKVIKVLLESHPYEEVAYDLYSIENESTEVGLGCIGELKMGLDEEKFLKFISKVFDSRGVRYSSRTEKTVKRVALCGGSGYSLLGDAIASGADAYLTADLKYHNYFDADNRILLIDIGHYESEKFSTEILKDLIIKKFPKFAVRFSETNTNPINYF